MKNYFIPSLDNVSPDPRSRFFIVLDKLKESLSKREIPIEPILEDVFNECLGFIWFRDISEWHEIINEFRPFILLEDHPETLSSLKYLDVNRAKSLIVVYNNLPNDWIEVFDNLFWMAFDSIVGDENSSELIFKESMRMLISME